MSRRVLSTFSLGRGDSLPVISELPLSFESKGFHKNSWRGRPLRRLWHKRRRAAFGFGCCCCFWNWWRRRSRHVHAWNHRLPLTAIFSSVSSVSANLAGVFSIRASVLCVRAPISARGYPFFFDIAHSIRCAQAPSFAMVLHGRKRRRDLVKAKKAPQSCTMILK